MTTLTALPGVIPGRRSARRGAVGTRRRRVAVLGEILVAVLACLVLYGTMIDPARRLEVTLATAILELFGHTNVSGALGDGFIVFGPDPQPLVAMMTTSCSALPSLIALAALTLLMFRNRPHAVLGFTVAAAWILLANQARLVLSLIAGERFGVGALILFHDWVGALITFAYTLVGLIITIALTMASPERAEQNMAGQHTANRPAEWAKPGLGYRPVEVPMSRSPRFRPAGFLHRRLLPARMSQRLAARRERSRVDYRLGHFEPEYRAEMVAALVGKGLGVHTATLIAVAAHETDPLVLDALAGAIAGQQWEPVSRPQILALRLWARAWLMRPPAASVVPELYPGMWVPPMAGGQALVLDPAPLPRPVSPVVERPAPLVAVTGAGGPAGVSVIRALKAAGYRVLALDADAGAAGLRLGDVGAVVPTGNARDYGAALLELVVTHAPSALVCTVAEEYRALSPIVDRLATYGCRTWLPDLSAVETCTDKKTFAIALHWAAVAHPDTADSFEEARLIPGPWIVKPSRGRGSRDVLAVDTEAELERAFSVVPDAIAQTRLTGREFTADVLVGRDGKLLACVPRWREETKAGISVRGTTFESDNVTEAVFDTLRAVKLTGPANVQGFADAEGRVTIVEVNPRFSGGLPLTLAAGADVVGTYLAGILDPDADLPVLTFQPGVRMARYYAEVFE